MDTAQTVDWAELTSFTPKQITATEALYTHRYVLYGGARGGGKSRWLRWAMIEYLISIYQDLGIAGVRGMLACETYRDLQDRQITKIKLEFPSWMGVLKDSKENGLAFHLDESLGGGVLALRNLDDPSKYQSSEFAIIGVDELTKIPKLTFDILRGSMRWPGVDHTVFMGATNPGGIGHAWVKALWVDRIFPPELAARKDEFIFIQSLPADNPHLSQVYWDELNSLPKELRQAWVHGNWDIFSGMAFPGWSDAHIVDPFDIPDYWVRVCGIDWGFAKPFCCLWVAKNPDTGQYIVYRELYQDGLTDVQQARLIREHSEGEMIRARYADPSMWSAKSQTVVTSTADIYAGEGVSLTKADNGRLSGKRKVDRLLMPGANGQPGLVIFDTCRHFIRTFPLLARAKNDPEDVDTEQEDHAYDALRYSLTVSDQRKQQRRPTTISPIRKAFTNGR